MKRRFGLVFMAILLLGALLDATVHRDAVGLRTDQEEPWRAWEGSSSGTLAEAARERPAVGDRYSVYGAIRDLAPGVVIIRDSAISPDALPRSYLQAIGGARAVIDVDLSTVTAPEGAGSAAGEYQGGPWILHLGAEDARVLLAIRVRRTTHLIDPEAHPAAAPAFDAATVERVVERGDPVWDTVRFDPLRAIVAESAVIVLLMLTGGLLLARKAGRDLLRLPMALVVGVALHAALAVLLLPGVWGLMATLAIAVLVATLRRRGEGFGWRRSDVPRLVTAATGITAIVGIVRTTGTVFITPDSFDYWSQGALLARGALGLAELDIKRGLSQQALHATGFAVGSEGLQALGHVLLAAGLLLLVGGAVARVAPEHRTVALAASSAMAIALVLSPQILALAAYLNTHVLVAVLVLTLALLLGAGDADDPARDRRLLPAVAAVIAALVLARAEGAALVGLLLIGTLAVRTPRPVWRVAWGALATAALAWAGVLLAGQGIAPALLVLMLIGGLAALVAMGVGLVPTGVRIRLPVLASVLLWGAVGAVVRSDSVRFFELVRLNIGQGFGGWGVLAPLLVIAGLLAVLGTTRARDLATSSARWAVLGFIPFTVLARLADGLEQDGAGLGTLLSGGGRFGWGDSANRMWMHGVLLVAFLVVRAVSDPVRRGPEDRAVSTGRVRASAGLALAVAFAVAGSWVAVQWRPAHVPQNPAVEEFVVAEVEGVQPMGELLDGDGVEQTFVLVDPDLGPGRTPRRICVDVPIVTYGRTMTGSVEVSLVRGERQATEVFRDSALWDWSRLRTCLDLDSTASISDPVDVRVSGLGGSSGAVPSLLTGPASGFGALATTVNAEGSSVRRRIGPLVAAVVVLAERPLGPFEAPLERAALLLPWFATVAGTANLMLPAARGRRGPARMNRSRG